MTVEMSEWNKEVARNFVRKIEDEILPELERIREELESDESNWAEDDAWEGTTDQERAQTLIGLCGTPNSTSPMGCVPSPTQSKTDRRS